MKRFAISFLPALGLFIFFSCDEVEDLADIDFTTTLEKTIAVTVPTTDEMTVSVVLDATSDPEILQYADKIKEYEVTELFFAIENYIAQTEDEIYFNGTFGFSDLAGNQATSTCSVSPLNVTHWVGTGNFDLSTCNTIIAEISDVFTVDNGVKIYLTGTFTEAPFSFDLKVIVKVKVTANPL